MVKLSLVIPSAQIHFASSLLSSTSIIIQPGLVTLEYCMAWRGYPEDVPPVWPAEPVKAYTIPLRVSFEFFIYGFEFGEPSYLPLELFNAILAVSKVLDKP